jgi:hypothetical protein
LGVDAPQRPIKFAYHLGKRQAERDAPPDQYVIVSLVQASHGRQPHHLAQAAANTVAFHGVAHLARNREADARTARITAPARLQHERAAGRPRSRRGSPKVRPALQPLHGNTRLGNTRLGKARPGEARLERTRARYALSRLRPCARRAATTLRPPLVAMRARKPWRRLRTNLLGW